MSSRNRPDIRMDNLLAALSRHGIDLRHHVCDLGTLDESDRAWVDALIDALDKDQDIARRLVDAVFERLAGTSRRESRWSEAMPVYRAHQSLFDARMCLWQAMVDAARTGDGFTDVELSAHEERIAALVGALDRARDAAGEDASSRAQAAFDRELKERFRLQFDDGMIADINRLVGNLVAHRPSLIVGDKGVAKTQVAKFVMSLYGAEPVVISVKGDMMSDELIGHLVHDPARKTFVFEEGALVKAMRGGYPILLDEVNFGDQSVIARLQDILVKVPGDQAFIQEEGSTVTVAPGFAVMATANEASSRYRNREVLDPAIRDRFDIVMRGYPDIKGTSFMDEAPDLMRLAVSSAVDEHGEMSPHVDRKVLGAFVQMAHATQYLYSVPAKDITVDVSGGNTTGSMRDSDHPLMTDCITPRVLSNLVADCAQGNLPDRRFDISLLVHVLDTLDQAGSHDNSEIARQLWVILDIGTLAETAS